MSGLSKRTGRDHEITSELECFRLWRRWIPSLSRGARNSILSRSLTQAQYGLLRAGATRTELHELIDKWLLL
jgi:hypothetical protein